MEATMPSSAFGERLRALRTSAGLTLAQLAERAGMHLQSVAQIEAGKRANPSWESVVALAKALGVPTDAFLDPGEPAAEPEPQSPPTPRRKRKK